MARRWTQREDTFLHEFYDAVGDLIGTHDFGRPKGAATRRVEFLKKSGAWGALNRMRQAEIAYRKCVGLPVDDDPPILKVVS